jgi:mono/diheme cytochrome c family protein
MISNRSWRRALGPVTALAIAAGIVFASAERRLHRVDAAAAPAGGEAGWVAYGAVDPVSPRALPYWVWYLLPRVFKDLMPGPGGYAAFGVVWESGQETPAGFAKVAGGYPRVVHNCALCHTATYRTKPEETPHVVVGGPGHTVDIQALFRFYGLLLDQLSLITDLSAADRLLYRTAIVPRARGVLSDWMATASGPAGTPTWGPGRAHFAPAPAGAAAADVPPIWQLGARAGAGKRLGWGGEWESPAAAVTESALGLGAARGDAESQAGRLVQFLDALPAPRFPFVDKVDRSLASRGQAIFAARCADCHAADGKRTGTVIPIAEIDTDRERLRGSGSGGYVAPPLSGIWLRAPYLHNGSVPTVRALLEPEGRRPLRFSRGYDVIDPDNLGFLVTWPDQAQAGFNFDTSLPGNGKGGHRYGTELAGPDKDALIEYLKTQ